MTPSVRALRRGGLRGAPTPVDCGLIIRTDLYRRGKGRVCASPARPNDRRRIPAARPEQGFANWSNKNHHDLLPIRRERIAE